MGGGATAIERCFLATFVRKDGATGWRLLAVATDGSAALLQQGEVVWVREEALAGAGRGSCCARGADLSLSRANDASPARQQGSRQAQRLTSPRPQPASRVRPGSPQCSTSGSRYSPSRSASPSSCPPWRLPCSRQGFGSAVADGDRFCRRSGGAERAQALRERRDVEHPGLLRFQEAAGGSQRCRESARPAQRRRAGRVGAVVQPGLSTAGEPHPVRSVTFPRLP